jgi:signal transduction histidine kinase
LFSPEGKIDAVVESYRDITTTAHMEREVLELEKSRHIGSLAAGVAHELRNPLAVINSSAQLSLSAIDKIRSEDTKRDLAENLEAIIENVSNAEQVVKHLLDFSKPLKTDFAVGPIQTVIKRVLNLVKHRCRRQEVSLDLVMAETLPSLKLDADALTHAILNFVINSLEASAKGQKVFLEVAHHPTENFLSVSVKDEGKGVPAEARAHLFEPFFTTKEDGVGLGMSIAQRIINLHGGGVHFESREKEGTTVTIRLPIVQTQPSKERE